MNSGWDSQEYTFALEPFGQIQVRWNDHGQLSHLNWISESGAEEHQQVPRVLPSVIQKVIEEIRQFSKTGEPISQLDWGCFASENWTEFQRKVYQAIRVIPHGETRSYAWVAERIGVVGASRAVGQALKKNPLLILIPCHRVVSSSGQLGGFMGKMLGAPEVELKRALLDLEDTYVNPMFSFCS